MLRPWGPILTLLLLSMACAKGDKIPAYLTINSIALDAGPAQGGNTIRATDAWVFADEELIGVWELPARVPVLRDGNTTIAVIAGVKNNGMYDDRLRYPFFTRWTEEVSVVPAAATALQPVVRYVPQAQFWIEDFGDAGTQLIRMPNSDTTLLLFNPDSHPNDVLNGTTCGGFVLDATKRRVRLRTDQAFAATGGPLYFEMDYRNDVQLTLGLRYLAGGVITEEPYVYIAPTLRPDGSMPWNKIYIDLAPRFNLAGISQRDIYLEATLPSGSTSGRAFFDNLKVVRSSP